MGRQKQEQEKVEVGCGTSRVEEDRGQLAASLGLSFLATPTFVLALVPHSL